MRLKTIKGKRIMISMNNTIFALALLTTQLIAYTMNIPLENIKCEFEEVQGFKRIVLENGIIPDMPGAPEIPLVVYVFTLPTNQNIKKVNVVNAQWEQIPGQFDIFPVQKRAIIGQLNGFFEPDSVIYCSSEYYPQTIIQGFHSGNLRGYRIGQISIAPFRYNPVLKRLEVLRNLNVEIETELVQSGIAPIRQTSLSKTIFEKFVSSLVSHTGIRIPIINPDCCIEENPENLLPAELPSLLGPPVDLVIITTEQTASAYDEFQRLKKLLGYNTVIKTMTWIKEHYQGVDDAERIRNFLKEAVAKWGVSFVLLGNDVPDIPTRWVWVQYVMGNYPAHITTDLYFSDLDKNWNFDGDDRFGEVSDSIDLYPDVLVGRIPAHNSDDVIGYFNKMHSYIFDYQIPPNGMIPYYRKALFNCSMFISEYDSYYMANRLSMHLPNSFAKKFLYEKPKQDYLNAIYEDHNLITFLAHGDVNLMRARTNPREFVTNFTYDSLTNTKYPLMVVITCYSGPFQEDCLGEHWVMNRNGGGIGFIGPSSSSVAQDQEVYVTYLFDALFDHTLSGGLAWAKIPLVGQSQFDTWSRVFQYSLNLLGDPTLSMWRTTPHIIDSLVLNKDTLHVGQDTVIMNIFPQLDTFFVIFNKENELFIKDTGFAGISITPLKTRSEGFVKYTILSSDFVPHIESVYVKPSVPFVTYHHYRVGDSLGNGNGIANPDEVIDLYLSLVNNGDQEANSVSLEISTTDSFATIITDSTYYGTILPGEIKENITPLRLRIGTKIPDGYGFNLFMKVDYDFTNHDTCQITAESPILSLFTQQFTGEGSLYKILPFVENQGHCHGDSVYAKIQSYSDTITILDSIVYFPLIQPGLVVPAQDSFSLQLNTPGSLCYKFSLFYHNVKVQEQRVVLTIPQKPDSLWTFGRPTSISLNWTPVNKARGYRVYRSTEPSGIFEFLKNPLAPVAYFEDLDVHHGVDYYYYLLAVDSSMNQGLSSDTIKAQTNPLTAQGWPRTVYGYLFSSPNFGDLDPSYPGFEITVCGKNGDVYVWHYDGTPTSNDPDGRIFSCGKEIWSSPAVGDVNNDGSSEICFGIRYWEDNLYVLAKYDSIWLPLPGWPKSLAGGVLGSPAFADIDEDGDLEIFVITESGKLCAFHHDGSGVYSPDGLLKNLYGWHGGSPAIGDINDDGNLEIVACGGSNSDSLFVWDRYGNYLEPFPVTIARKMSYSPVLGDLIGNSNLEICFYSDSTEFVNVVDSYGNVVWQFYIPALGDVEAYPVLANIIGNERPEIICGSNQGMQTLLVFDSLGNIVPGFPPAIGHDYKLPIVTDVDGDSSLDVICGAADWNLYAFHNDGNLVRGFPIHFGIRIEQSPAVFDIDGDGKLELMVGANDFKFWVFNLDSKIFDWPKFRYDPYNSGCYKSLFWPGIKEGYVKKNNGDRFYFGISPNPFRNHLAIKFQIPNSNHQTNSNSQNPNNSAFRNPKSEISLRVYDVSGRVVKSFDLESCIMSRESSIVWDGCDDLGRRLPSGVYFVRLEAGDYERVEKAVLLR